VTWSDLESTIEKYYNKGNSLSRELRVSELRSVRDLEALIQGGVVANTVLQGLNVLRQDISSLNESVKGILFSYRDMKTMFKEYHVATIRLVDKVDEFIRKEV